MTAGPDRSWSLPAACGLAAFEAIVAIAILMFRSHRAAPGAFVVLAAKLPVCWLVLKRHAAAVIFLFIWEVTVLFAVLVGPGLSIWLRLLDIAVASGVIALLAMSVHLFPTPQLPHRS
ncbi:MAG: hypothetical protein JWO37_879 [Acidimicrobiales bacterium]|nr:hypothetical protein [Acidimicrobiales bacterium]